MLSPFFLTERNFANLLNQAATLVVLGMALVFVLLLGEIDLSAGVTGGVGMALFVVLNAQFGIPWPLALLLGFGFGFLIGALIGFFVARVGIPSFVVTLGLFLGLQGLALVVIGPGGLFRVEVPELIALQNGNLPVWAGWVMLLDHPRRLGRARRSGTAPVARRRAYPTARSRWCGSSSRVIAVLGGAFVFILNQDRGQSVNEVQGVPNVVPIVLLILWVGTFVLDRTKFGRYVYAIGGNAEAARRSGVKVRWIKWWAFVICSSLAVVLRAAQRLARRIGRRHGRSRHRAERCRRGGRRRCQPLRRTRTAHARRDRRARDRRDHERPRPAQPAGRRQPAGHRRRAHPRRDRRRALATPVRRGAHIALSSAENAGAQGSRRSAALGAQ